MGSGSRLLRCGVAALLILLIASAGHASPESLSIRQSCLAFPELTVFADLLDKYGKAFPLTERDSLSAILGGKPLEIMTTRPYSARDDGLLVIFLIDTSASVGPGRFAELQEAVSAWIRRLGPRDRAAVMSFGENVSTVQGFTAEQNALLYAVQSLSPRDGSAHLNLGLMRALDLARVKAVGLPDRRIILLCSDGFREAPGGATADEVRTALSVDPIPVYAVLFDSPERESSDRNVSVQQLLNELGYDAGPVDGKMGPLTNAAIRVFQQSRGVRWDGSVSNELIGVLRTMARSAKDASLAGIGEFSRRSGGMLYRAGYTSFNEIFDSIMSSMDSAHVLTIELEGIEPDSTVRRLDIAYSDGVRTLADGVEIRLSSVPVKKEEAVVDVPKDGSFRWGFVPLITVVVLLMTVALLVLRKKRKSPVSLDGRVPGGREHTVQLPASPHDSRSDEVSVQVELTPFNSKHLESMLKGEIRGRLILGRKEAPSVLVVPGDATISARHCELQYTKGKLYVRDLESSNGTMVNGVPIQGNYPIEDGDRLTLGKTELRIRIIGAK